MSIDKITKQHVLGAVDKIEREGIELKRSRDYDYYRCSGVDAISAKFDGLVKVAEGELSRTSISGFGRHNNAIIRNSYTNNLT